MIEEHQGEPTTPALVAASAELLERLNAAESPLTVVSAALASLAAALGVEQAMVAIDDPEYGRQVFTSGRRPLGANGDMLWGPPSIRTEPSLPIEDGLARLIIAAVTTSFERAQASRALVTRPEALVEELRAAVDRSARYGWGFTLVLIRMDSEDGHTKDDVDAHLRVSDTLLELGPRDLALVLPHAADSEVPAILARVGQGGAVSTFCYGLAACPGDAADANELLALAAQRLRDAEATRDAPEIHEIEAPKV